KAQIEGSITHNLPELPRALARTGAALFTVSRLLFVIGLIVTAIALFLLFPGFTRLAAQTIGSDPLKSLGLGALLCVTVPVVAILIMFTILGIPLGLILFLSYLVSLLMGFLVAAFFLGEVGAQAFFPRARRSKLVGVLCLVVALGVMALINQLPYVGGPLMAAAVLVGMGAMSLHVWRHWDDPEGALVPTRCPAPDGTATFLQPAIARGVARYAGEPVALVVAESRYVAEDALERIVVEYEPLPAVTSADAALAAGAPRLFSSSDSNNVALIQRRVGEAVEAPRRGALAA